MRHHSQNPHEIESAGAGCHLVAQGRFSQWIDAKQRERAIRRRRQPDGRFDHWCCVVDARFTPQSRVRRVGQRVTDADELVRCAADRNDGIEPAVLAGA